MRNGSFVCAETECACRLYGRDLHGEFWYKRRVFNDAVDVGTERAGTVATVYGPCMWTFQRRAAVKIGLG